MSCLLSCLAGCGTTHAHFNYAAEPDPRKSEFVLGPSDVLRVSVWHNPDLSADPVVRPDGTITLPLIGDLVAAGLTTTKVRDQIAARLKTFVKDEAAVVTVAVLTVNSYRFTVAGNVGAPGSFAATRYLTVSEAISLAGGPTRFAAPDQIVIQRPAGNGLPARRIPIDYPKVLSGESPQESIPVLAGDVIYVP